MEQLAATYSRRRNASLAAIQASAVSQTLDASQWTTFTEQQNVPGFLLLDSIRFYKKATTTQSQLAPAVVTLRKESDDTKQRMAALLQDIHTYQIRLSRVEHNVQQVSEDLEAMDQQIDTVRRDNLRTNSVTTRNGQDVSQLAERLDVLERELIWLRAREKDTMDLRAEMRTLFVEFSAMFASLESLRLSLAQKQVVGSQASTPADMAAPSPDRVYELRNTIDKRPVSRRFTVHPEQPAADYDSSQSQLLQAHWEKPQARRPAVMDQNHSLTQSGRQEVSGFSSSSESDPQASVNTPHSALQPQVQQSTTPAEEDETASETSETDTASEYPESVVASSTAPKPSHAALIELLRQAVKKHSQSPRTSDNKFIWAFIDTIEDKELSKRFQMFLLNRFEHRLVSKSHRSARQTVASNRFIAVSRLKWPSFAQAVGEFVKSDR
jgi:uncharacterized protein YoxC